MRYLVLLLVFAPLLIGAAQEPEADPRPNVIWITLDDVGPVLGSYGGPARTPNLDALAARGLRFERCWSTAPIGSPARSAWMTGCSPQTSGSQHHRSSRPLPGPLEPMTGLLRGAGYAITRLPLERQSAAAFAAGAQVTAGRLAVVTGVTRQDFNFSRGTDLFRAWDERDPAAPFFATVDFSLPPAGDAAVTAWTKSLDPPLDAASAALPKGLDDTAQIRVRYAAYLEGVAWIDAQVARVLAWVEAEGLGDSTWIVVTSDNGMPLPGYKGACTEEGLRVPLLLVGPGLAAGVRSELVSTLDLAPTTLGRGGVAAPEWMEGRDLLAKDLPARRLLFAGRDRIDANEGRVRAVRGERYSLVKEPGQGYGLYDLDVDPGDRRSLAGNPELEAVEARLQQALDAWIERVDASNGVEDLASVYPERVRVELAAKRSGDGQEDPQAPDAIVQTEPRVGPNIVLILADDLGYGELGCYGQAKIATPYIDSLASTGVRFAQAYSGHPVCAPSRAVLLGGLHTGHNPIRNNSPWASKENPSGEGQEPLPEGFPNLARWLGERGRATGCFGKWGLGGPGTVGVPLDQGFEAFLGYLCQKQAHDHYPAHLWHGGQKQALRNPGFTPAARWTEAPADAAEYTAFQGEDYAPDVMREAALAFIDEHAAEPFFLYYPSAIPHVALQTPDAALGNYSGRGWDEGPYLGKNGYLPHPAPRAAYAAMISNLDRDVGALLKRLEERGLGSDTIVIFTSDNGPAINGGADPDFFASTAGPIGALAREGGRLRGHKGSVHEGGIRVPMIWSWPGRIPAGGIVERPVGFQDVWPTLAELLGDVAPSGVDGVSFGASLMESYAPREPNPLYWEIGRQQAVRVGDWKLVRTVDSQGRVKAALFDLASDPWEQTDLAGDRPEELARLVALARAVRTPSKRFASPFDAGL